MTTPAPVALVFDPAHPPPDQEPIVADEEADHTARFSSWLANQPRSTQLTGPASIEIDPAGVVEQIGAAQVDTDQVVIRLRRAAGVSAKASALVTVSCPTDGGETAVIRFYAHVAAT